MSIISGDDAQNQVRRYCSQCLQLEPSPDLPEPRLLRETSVQDAIFNSLFAEDAVRFGPPLRYQLKMLKVLVAQIEASIEDWDAHVSDLSGIKEMFVLLLRSLCLTTFVGGI